MTEKKYRASRSLMLVSILALLMIASSLPGAQSMLALSDVKELAAPAYTITLNATQDTYTDINLATTNFDERLLNAANSPGAPEAPDVTTKVVFVAFDLSGVGFEIKRAVLRLSTLTCGGLAPVDVVNVTAYGIDNSVNWSEDSLTWATQPEQPSTSALADLDAGATVFNRSQTYTWTDDNQGAFATWLETQRGANDGSATLMLVIDNADNPGMADVFFEDREGSGAAYGCADSLGGPTLEIRDTTAEHQIYLPLVVRGR
jgi:hypothetical protein